MVFVKKDIGQTTEQQRNFNEWPISELHGEVDSKANQFKTTPYLPVPAIIKCASLFSALRKMLWRLRKKDRCFFSVVIT
jgi:hypothetical protein